MRAVPQLSVVLGTEATASAHAFSALGQPLGYVVIEFEGQGALQVSSSSPQALQAVEEAFREARWQLLTLIAEKNSALANAPGADALDEAGTETAEGEQPSPRPAAPPSNPPDGGL